MRREEYRHERFFFVPQWFSGNQKKPDFSELIFDASLRLLLFKTDERDQ